MFGKKSNNQQYFAREEQYRGEERPVILVDDDDGVIDISLVHATGHKAGNGTAGRDRNGRGEAAAADFERGGDFDPSRSFARKGRQHHSPSPSEERTEHFADRKTSDMGKDRVAADAHPQTSHDIGHGRANGSAEALVGDEWLGQTAGARPQPSSGASDRRGGGLLDEQVRTISEQAINELRQAMKNKDMSKLAADSVMVDIGRGEVTLEEVVRESVRPYLKSWVDHNLETIVKDIVRRELARLV